MTQPALYKQSLLIMTLATLQAVMPTIVAVATLYATIILSGTTFDRSSSTTLAAAELTERICCGMELDAKYVDVIVQRWQTLSGKQARLDGDGRTFEEIAAERQKGEQ